MHRLKSRMNGKERNTTCFVTPVPTPHRGWQTYFESCVSRVRGSQQLTITAMSVIKTPTSSLSGTSTNHTHCSIRSLHSFNAVTAAELLANQLWCRTKVGIKSFGLLFCEDVQEESTAHSSSIAELPQELVKRIISYFIYDKRTLLACSATCCSWYIATIPHLHYTLTTDDDIRKGSKGHRWPRPLRKSYNLGLLPLVKRLRIRSGDPNYDEFTSRKLGWRALAYFSALTNLQELGIDNLRVSSFFPDIQRYFGHLAPTLRFLALKEPKGSCRQILYFIGLFPKLEDLKINYPTPRNEMESTAGATLVPPSTPPLRGRLTLTCFTREKLVKEMILLFGALRFRQMDLFGVRCTPLLLDACAETLETLRLYPTDAYRKEFLKRRRGELKREIYSEQPCFVSVF
jgi:hypothetical protein